jgi:small ligand-binding sensory domain FIST
MSTAPGSLRFIQAHGTHPQPELALELVWAQLASQLGLVSGAVASTRMSPTLGWCYISDELAHGAPAIFAGLRERLPQVAWVGGVGAGVLATGVEYIDEPALVVMLCNLPTSQFRIFHGRHPLPAPHSQAGAQAPSNWRAFTAQVHADGQSPEVSELIEELAARTDSSYLFGGLCVGTPQSTQLALDPRDVHADDAHSAQGLWHGGLSGVAFSDRVRLVSRVTQGCEPIGPQRRVTAAQHNVIYELDGLPALTCLLRDLDVTVNAGEVDWQREALPKVRATLVGLTDPDSDLLAHGSHFGADTRVRHIMGLDPARRGVAISEPVHTDMHLAFCQRHVRAARQDLVRICAEIREEFDPMDHPGHPPVGAVYISCAGRGGPHFGSPNAEMALISHALGDIPVVGMFAGGEIARRHIYGYTGVLTVFGA